MIGRLKRWYVRHFITQEEVNERIGGMVSDYNVFQHNRGGQPYKPGWLEYPMMDSNDVHVVPLEDEIEHGFTEHCPCAPTIETKSSGRRNINHRAWDGRETIS